MFFKSSILNIVSSERRKQGIDDSDATFKLMLLESSIQVKEAKLKNSINDIVNYFLDNRIYVPKDPNSNIRKREDGVISSGYILLHINDLRNKMEKGILTHKDFDVIPNYEGLRDRLKELFKLEIFKKREEARKIKEEEEREQEMLDKKRSEELFGKISNTKNFSKEYYLRLSNHMHFLSEVRNIDIFMEYLLSNNDILVPADSPNQKSFDSRKLVYFVHYLKSKSNLEDSDFNILPSYDGFRKKVKKLLGFEK
jgi:hypothetical protein